MVEKLERIDDDSSILHLGRHAREVSALLEAHGRSSADLTGGALRFTVDEWVTVGEASLCVLPDATQGFVLDELAPDTEVEYAILLRIRGAPGSADVEAWLNNDGRNYRAKTEMALELDDEVT